MPAAGRPEAPLIAVLFPGQGSQAAGMGCDLYDASAIARDTFDEASDVLGYDLTGVCRVGSPEELARTEVTQPALLAHSVAALRLLREGGFAFDAALGHSLGEYIGAGGHRRPGLSRRTGAGQGARRGHGRRRRAHARAAWWPCWGSTPARSTSSAPASTPSGRRTSTVRARSW